MSETIKLPIAGWEAADGAALVRVPLFTGLSTIDLAGLLTSASVQKASAGNLLFLQGDKADAFYVVLDGWVRLFRQGESGDEMVIGVFARGESFAEAAIFASGVYPVSASAIENSRLLCVPGASFIARLREKPDLALGMMGAMSWHLRAMLQQVEQLNMRSSAERLAAFLVRLTAKENGSASVRLPMDKSLIAARLGMRPETLSRNFSKLKRLGLAQTKGAEVTVPDVGALNAFARGEA